MGAAAVLVVAFLATGVAAGAAYQARVLAAAPLRELGVRAGVVMGTAVSDDALTSSAALRRTLARDAGSVTAENAMKWSELEPQRGVDNYAPADRLTDFAAANGQEVRGHALVWYRQLPGWLFADGQDPSADELRTALRQHIIETVGRYRGRVASWDVVNEAMGDDGALRGDVFLSVLGPGYVADAFRWAHEADPSAQLLYNDYGLEDGGPKADAVLDLVDGLIEQGVPIDGVGFQGHVLVEDPPTRLRETMDRFAALGLVTPITEADVRLDDSAGVSAVDAQGRVFASMVRACLDARACPSFTTWGAGDQYSWIPSEYPGEGRALLRDERLTAKPAYWEVRAELIGRPWRWWAG